MIERGVNINRKNSSHETALSLSISTDNFEAANILLNNSTNKKEKF